MLYTKQILYAVPFILAVQMSHSFASETEIMVVESSRIDIRKEDSPQSVTIITREQIEQQLSISTDSSQVLSNLLPGYALNTQKLNNSSQTFRGRDVLYMVDGVPQSNSLRKGSRAAHTIDLSMVERIEVIKGASAIHGLGATGGIINFITKTNRSDDVNQHASIQLTSPTTSVSTDTLSYKASYQLEGATERLDYLVGLTGEVQGVYLDANGQYVGAATVRGDIMDSRSYDFMTKIGYWIDDEQDIKFLYNRYQLKGQMNYASVKGDRDKGVATSSVKGTPKGAAPSNIVQTFNVAYTHNDFFGMKLSSQGFLQDFSGRYGASTSRSFQDPNTAETIYDQSQNESKKIGAKLSVSKSNLFDGKLNATAGLDLLKDTTSQKLILTNRTYVPKTSYVNYAPFIQLTFNPLEKLTVQAGARYENAKLDINTYQTVAARNGVTVQGGKPSFSEMVYNAGAVFELTPSVRLFGNYSQGFGMPDVGRVLRGVKKTGQKVNELVDLSPIITDNYEGGVRFNNGDIDFEISYYISNSDLGSRIVENNGLYTVKREKKEIQGFETSLGYSLSDSHNLDAGYSYIKGFSDTNGDGNVDTKLTGADIPANKLRLAWTAQWNHGLTSMIQANHAFSRTFDDKELEFQGYTLFDATLSYKLPVGKLNASVSNLLNEDHFTYYSQSAYKNDNFYFKGRGRTFTLAYKLDF
ncbi:TonB-dependent receptor [Vibrio tapetis]|uniref:TonB-dependent receptor n=1 Tax=Vibrio tapetis TaxID=52443 RepID=UPI0025B2A151|nr:TonB-dependent receptor [Vibrio tapetis]